MATEWLCRGCEVDVDKMVIHAKMEPPTIERLGVTGGSPQIVINKMGICESCGQYLLLFEYEKTEPPQEELDRHIDEAIEIVEVLKDAPKEDKEAPQETETQREIRELRERLAKLEG